MKWFKKAQMQYNRSDESINNMKVLKNTIEANVEAEWEDAEDFERRHYTRETGYVSGEVGGDIDLAGKIYMSPEDVDIPELYLKEVIEDDPPASVVKIVEDAIRPVNWYDVNPEVTVEVTRLEPIDVGLYDAVVKVSVNGSYRYDPNDYTTD
jgi:hypothetical protein